MRIGTVHKTHCIYDICIITRNNLKNLQLKKGIGIEIEKVCKQVRDQIVWKQVEDTSQGLL